MIFPINLTIFLGGRSLSWTGAREVARHVLSFLPSLRELRFQFVKISLIIEHKLEEVFVGKGG